LAEAPAQPVETKVGAERPAASARFHTAMVRDGEPAVNAGKEKDDETPPAVINSPPAHELERKLKRNPKDPDAKADVGSDESMDASDPPAAAQPGTDEPAPSSSFPE
jgi:hypothetical protein